MVNLYYSIYPVTRIVNKKVTVIFTVNSFYKKLHGWSSLACHWSNSVQLVCL